MAGEPRTHRSVLSRLVGAGLVAVAAVLAVSGCSASPKGLPKGPPPEYERPPLPGWDAGTSVVRTGGGTDPGPPAPGSGLPASSDVRDAGARVR
ncbi:MAG TPA: hypothetical protein VHE30_27110 [Polyangiaceae bacterium]|nr:hypothetical protein [Polyangiaceae bacterium]